MPVRERTRKPKDAKSLLNRLRAQAREKDDTAICHSVQADLDVGGTATYEHSSDEVRTISLSGEEYLVFLIMGSFTLDGGTEVTTGRGLGHFVYDANILTLEPATAVVIISGY